MMKKILFWSLFLLMCVMVGGVVAQKVFNWDVTRGDTVRAVILHPETDEVLQHSDPMKLR